MGKFIFLEKIRKRFSCEIYSNQYFALCAVGGGVTCGLTHTLLTPLDIVKCRLQVNPQKYQSLIHGVNVSVRAAGVAALTRGWTPTLVGYTLHGAAKYSGYEFFKYKCIQLVDPKTAYKQRTYLYLAAAACADVVADCFLAPFEATKVRMQTAIGYSLKMRIVMPIMLRREGLGTFFRGLPPLWGRQVPYTMMKFASSERTVEYLYKNVMLKPCSQCSKAENLMVAFAASYITGGLCAFVSHPPDTVVSQLNRDPQATVGKIISEAGFFGIWSGLMTRMLMLGTLTGLQGIIYSAFIRYTQIPQPPPPPPPPALPEIKQDD